jgi:hypothetical protein
MKDCLREGGTGLDSLGADHVRGGLSAFPSGGMGVTGDNSSQLPGGPPPSIRPVGSARLTAFSPRARIREHIGSIWSPKLVVYRGEVAELVEGGALLMRCGVKSLTPGSNPGLSAN